MDDEKQKRLNRLDLLLSKWTAMRDQADARLRDDDRFRSLLEKVLAYTDEEVVNEARENPDFIRALAGTLVMRSEYLKTVRRIEEPKEI